MIKDYRIDRVNRLTPTDVIRDFKGESQYQQYLKPNYFPGGGGSPTNQAIRGKRIAMGLDDTPANFRVAKRALQNEPQITSENGSHYLEVNGNPVARFDKLEDAQRSKANLKP